MAPLHRRHLLNLGLGTFGLSLADYFGVRQRARAVGSGRPRRATSCIVLYCWGGMSHHETWDQECHGVRGGVGGGGRGRCLGFRHCRWRRAASSRAVET